MPLVLSFPTEIAFLITGLIFFAFFSWRRPIWGIGLVVFCLPFYLLKVKIGCLPSNVLELMIGVVFLVGVARGVLSRSGGAPACAGMPQQVPHNDLSYWGKTEESSRLSSVLQEYTRKRVRSSSRRAFLIPSGLILVGLCLAILFSDDPQAGAGILKGWFLAPMALGLMIVSSIKSKKQLKFLLVALVLSGVVVSAVALVYFFQDRMTFDGRLSAFYLSPNHLAMYLAPIFILGLGLWSGLKNFWPKLVLSLAEGLMFLVIYLTFSYGAWIGIAAALIVLLLYREPLLMRSLLVLGLVAVLFFSQLGTEKFNNLIDFERSSVQSRLMVWKAAIMIVKDNPLLGIGPGMFQEKYLTYQEKFGVPYLEWAVPQPHNLFLAFWLQAGILGLLGFLGLLGIFFKKAIILAKKEPLSVILIAAMTYIIIHGLIDTTYWKNDLAIIFWIAIAMVIALGRLSRMESAGAKF